MKPETSDVLSATAAAATSGKVILLVDDEIPMQFLAWKLLKREGFTVLAASSGESALRTCRSYPGAIDLLLTDMEMTRMDGIELYQILAAERPGIKAVIMSGNVHTKERSDSAELPFLQKPLQLATMRQTIEAALEDRKLPD